MARLRRSAPAEPEVVEAGHEHDHEMPAHLREFVPEDWGGPTPEESAAISAWARREDDAPASVQAERVTRAADALHAWRRARAVWKVPRGLPLAAGERFLVPDDEPPRRSSRR